MTNKTERYFVVSESELVAYRRTAINQTLTDSMRWTDFDQEASEAEAACRARPVDIKACAEGYGR